MNRLNKDRLVGMLLFVACVISFICVSMGEQKDITFLVYLLPLSLYMIFKNPQKNKK